MSGFRDDNGNNVEMEVDPDGAGVVMDVIHRKVHEGGMFEVYLEDLDLDENDIINVALVTGNKTCNLTFEIEVVGGNARFQGFEDAVISANGTELKEENFNRVVGGRSISRFFTAPTITADGNKFVDKIAFGTTQGATKLGTTVRAGVERRLKPNSNYVFRVVGLADNILIKSVVQYYDE